MSNKKKDLQLGQPYGTATGKLRKSILFSLLQEVNKDICFQCKEQITKVDNLSIEHKVPWLDSQDPIETFFDLKNIAFSHLSCNTSAARRPTKLSLTKEERLLHDNARSSRNKKLRYTPESRRERYLKYGS